MNTELDTHHLSFIEIAIIVKEKLTNVDPEILHWSLPNETIALGIEKTTKSITELIDILQYLDNNDIIDYQMIIVKKVGLIIASLGRETAINNGTINDTEKYTLEIISVILLNLGGSRQIHGEISNRLQEFVKMCCSQLSDNNSDNVANQCNNHILTNSKEYSLKDVYQMVNKVLQSLSDNDVIQLLFGTLPDICRHIAEQNYDYISPLLLRWRNKTNKMINSLETNNDKSAMIAMAGSTKDLLNIVAFLLNNLPMEEVIIACQQWIESFFENATGSPVNINVERVLTVLRAGLQDQEENNNIFNYIIVTETPEQKLQLLNVNLENIPENAYEPLLIALDPTGETDEMFTCRPLIENGVISKNLSCFIKNNNDIIHVFVYDTDSIKTWINMHHTVPETRESTGNNVRIIDIS